jgi:UDP-4-amino-4,6-dideoxy-N-acetyl-beta-L-altrosamine transaminase
VTSERRFLPYGRQCIEEDDVAAVVAALKSDWLTTGPAVRAFEDAFAAAVDARFAVACSSGTAGLHIACLALGLGPGTSAVAPTNSFVASANAIRYVGAAARLADIDPTTGLMRPEDFDAALAMPGPPVRAVIPVHFAGQTVDMESLAEKAATHDIAIIEDACHAVGSASRSRSGQIHKVGGCRFSQMTVFSLHPVKTVTMGEGGVVTTNDAALHERLCHYRSHGIARTPGSFKQKDLAFDEDGSVNPWYYEAQDLGFNYRASDINCALGLSQLRKLDRFVARRQELADRYDRQLARLAPRLRPLGKVQGCTPALHLYVVLIDFDRIGKSRAAVMRELADLGVGSQVHYIPIHRQPLYAAPDLHLPEADAYYRQCLSLPLFPTMADADVDRVVQALDKALP